MIRRDDRVADMDVFFYWLLGALIFAMALYFVIYGAVIAALRQYRREAAGAGARATPNA